MNYTNSLRRFVFRRDLPKRIRARFADYNRRLRKNEVSDLGLLFSRNNPKTVLDVGANVGFMTWQFAKLFQSATIYALEPDPLARQSLELTHRGNLRVRVFPLALAEREAELEFLQRRTTCNSSFFKRATDDCDDVCNRIRVHATTLDKFCEEHSIEHIDLLKTDTEGADLLVLHGGKSMLGRAGIEVVMTEVLFVPTFRGQATLDEIAGFLKGFGYAFFNLYIGRETIYGQACYGNAVFISNRMQQILSEATRIRPA